MGVLFTVGPSARDHAAQNHLAITDGMVVGRRWLINGACAGGLQLVGFLGHLDAHYAVW